MIAVILFLTFFCVSVLIYAFLPILTKVAISINKRQAQQTVTKADIYLQDQELQKVYRLGSFSPVVLAVCGFLFFPQNLKLAGFFVGLVVGIILPRMYANSLISSKKSKFNDQLINAIMIMSSSFRGGLSLVQAIEAVVEEMPEPIKSEFGVVLGENKMGVTLDDGLNRLYKRMPSIELQQIITSILLARETGGNLPVIFSRIVMTIRERKKTEQNLKTLTIQGKIQAVVMSLLPIFFVIGVSANNPKFFDIMLNSDQGRNMLMIAAALWVVGSISIWKIGQFKDV